VLSLALLSPRNGLSKDVVTCTSDVAVAHWADVDVERHRTLARWERETLRSSARVEVVRGAIAFVADCGANEWT
jgi:hypothetical protein